MYDPESVHCICIIFLYMRCVQKMQIFSSYSTHSISCSLFHPSNSVVYVVVASLRTYAHLIWCFMYFALYIVWWRAKINVYAQASSVQTWAAQHLNMFKCALQSRERERAVLIFIELRRMDATTPHASQRYHPIPKDSSFLFV